MVGQEDVGHLIKYWKNGQRCGVLLSLEKSTANIKHPVKKRVDKVPAADCEPIKSGESKTMVSIYQELCKVANVEGQKPGESDNDYIIRIMGAIQTVDENSWNTLSVDAQKWFNEAAEQLGSLSTIPPCPGFTGKDKVEHIATTVNPSVGPTATEAVKQIHPVTTANTNSTTTGETVVVKKPKRQQTGIMDAVRKIVILHPDWSSRQVYDYLRNNGFPNAKLDTISVDGGNIRRVLEIAKELGWKAPGVSEGEVVETGEQSSSEG